MRHLYDLPEQEKVTALRTEIATIVKERGFYRGIERHISLKLGIPETDVKEHLQAMSSEEGVDESLAILSAPSENDRKAYEMSLLNLPMSVIAEQCQMNEESVENAIMVSKRWLATNQAFDLRAEQQEQYFKLKAIGDIAMESFQRSREDSVQVTERVSDKNGNETITVRKGQSGNPSFLETLRNVMADQRSILGLDAPKKTAMTNHDGTGPAEINVNVREMSEEDQEVILASFRILDKEAQS